MTAHITADRAAAAYAAGLWVSTTLADSLQTAAQQTPQRVLLVDGATRLNCEQLHSRATALAAAMRARMPGGSVVSFMLPNWHEAAVVYLAATMAGMVVNPILPSLRDAELRFILADSGARMLFAPAQFRGHDYPAMLTRVTAALSEPPEVVLVRGSSSDHTAYPSLLNTPRHPVTLPTLDPDATRLLLYTSGTTGRPKGVLHSHNSINALMHQLGRHWRMQSGATFLVPSPIAHIGGSIYAFEAPLLLGCTAVLMDIWNPEAAVGLMLAERCTHVAGATPFLRQLLAAARDSGTRLPDLKLFVCGGASVPAALIREAAEYFHTATVTRVYGSSEVPVATVGSLGPHDLSHAAETDGRAGIADIKLVPRPDAPPGEGEICVRGPQMLVGYQHPEDERDCFDAQGYFATGDLGRWVDEDYLLVTGRLKDVIIRNGENISAREVEDILAGHPQIGEVAVVGIPDPRTGERACAVIVPAGPTPPGVAELRAMLAQRGVAPFKAPEQVAFWDALPKNDAGKVLKQQIRAKLTQAEVGE
ncbi:AMP-binding protein [Mycolicibacter hiberniae]|uniref:Cyclohexanecarboxylate-CoA ligase n=1 Tax=Mycolicibacter hiberniae TaxID=29314 RepID=A0A7I7WWC4_9MYCO|nr:AMP-binding protein [Mycolicibacter hiberniae]MCV7086886.1 AMP-binding protein [Mycolicibacter hiberniae]ORV70871.1 cyclohexanecarboxylate-CoA ligase [Mycolicibacter hiberniae]BBZ21814.1 cyclohexanecarboxylate-CoA ligase [Mycolicibacter hiberniae]